MSIIFKNRLMVQSQFYHESFGSDIEIIKNVDHGEAALIGIAVDRTARLARAHRLESA